MSQMEKFLLRVLRGTSDAHIGFDELCNLLTHMGFELRVRGSHHMFGKPYQVKQVRNVIVKYKLEV